jgi:hypothetical protein
MNILTIISVLTIKLSYIKCIRNNKCIIYNAPNHGQ